MADSRDDPDVFWVEPRLRAIIPLDGLPLLALARQVDPAGPLPGDAEPRFRRGARRLRRAARRAIPRAGSASGSRRATACCTSPATPIRSNAGIDGALVGGLYGVSFDRAFCGESMFSRARDASKVALAWLVVLLRRAGAELLDCQFLTEHLASLGAVEVSQQAYLELLADAGAAGAEADLPAAYCAACWRKPTALGAGVGEAEAVAQRRRRAGSGASSPGKLIAQSLTHTS